MNTGSIRDLHGLSMTLSDMADQMIVTAAVLFESAATLEGKAASVAEQLQDDEMTAALYESAAHLRQAMMLARNWSERHDPLPDDDVPVAIR